MLALRFRLPISPFPPTPFLPYCHFSPRAICRQSDWIYPISRVERKKEGEKIGGRILSPLSVCLSLVIINNYFFQYAIILFSYLAVTLSLKEIHSFTAIRIILLIYYALCYCYFSF